MEQFPIGQVKTGVLNVYAADHPLRQRAMRGRPQDKRIDRDVVLAVLNSLKKEGYRHVTIEKIAETVKRARTSLCRRWPSKRHLVAYAVVSTLDDDPAPDSGSLRRDLICAVDTLRWAFSGPLGQALPGLVADMAQDPVLARMIREQVLIRRRTSIKNAISRGIARSEIRSVYSYRCIDSTRVSQDLRAEHCGDNGVQDLTRWRCTSARWR